MTSTVSSVALRLALCKIADMDLGSGTQRVLIRVVPAGVHRTYVVIIPMECRKHVYEYLFKYAHISVPRNRDPLILIADQARCVIEAADNPVNANRQPDRELAWAE